VHHPLGIAHLAALPLMSDTCPAQRRPSTRSAASCSTSCTRQMSWCGRSPAACRVGGSCCRRWTTGLWASSAASATCSPSSMATTSQRTQVPLLLGGIMGPLPSGYCCSLSLLARAQLSYEDSPKSMLHLHAEPLHNGAPGSPHKSIGMPYRVQGRAAEHPPASDASQGRPAACWATCTRCCSSTTAAP